MIHKKSRIIHTALLVGFLPLVIDCTGAKYSEGLYAELRTNKGLIVLSLEFEKIPMTVANFVGLAEGRIRNDALPEGAPFFDGSKFHRVVPGHVIQAGAPKSDSDGNVPLGYMYPNEIHPDLTHNRAGILGMANGGPHTNGSQFYITLGDRSYLDGDYSVFGEVVEGMDVVFAIVQDDMIENIKIVRVGDKAKNFRPDTDEFERLKVQVQKKVDEQEREKKKRQKAILEKRWPDAVEMDSGLKYVIIQEGKGGQPGAGSKVRVRYTGEVLSGIKFFSTSDGTPDGAATGEEFMMEIGKDHVNPGFDLAVVQMRAGEKRVIIVPPDLAYGNSGFYAKEIQGKKRFVISPNSMLVYEVELLEIIS